MKTASFILISVSAVLFSLQFLFSQIYQKNNGTGLKATVVFSGYSKAVIMAIMLFIMKFQLEFHWFSFLIGIVYAINGLLMTYFSLKAFAVTNLSVYSVFSMLGGMILPFLLGVAVYNEKIDIYKILCCLLIAVSVILTGKTEKGKNKNSGYYLFVFIFNGMSGILFKIHQSTAFPHCGSTNFMFWASLSEMVICAAILLFLGEKPTVLCKKDVLSVIGYGAFCGIGNLFVLIATGFIPASVQYPIITGGVMALSTFIAVLLGQNVSLKSKIAAGIAFAASVFMAL